MTRLRYGGLVTSVAAAAALLGAPMAHADGGHGNGDGGHDGDDVVVASTQNPPAPMIRDDDAELNEDRDDAEMAPAPPQPVMEVEHEPLAEARRAVGGSASADVLPRGGHPVLRSEALNLT